MEPYEGSSWWQRVGFSVRFRLRSGALRLRGGWLQILQTAVAAGVAWSLAVLILGLERPTFAPIAAVIALGLAVDERGGLRATAQHGGALRRPGGLERATRRGGEMPLTEHS